MRSAVVQRAVLVVAVMLLLGCPSGEPTRYADRPFCGTDLQLTVTAGTAPTFTWNDECRVWTLRVEQLSTGTVMWSMGEDDESLDGPIVYGQLPPGAGEFGPAATLQAGIEYRALLVQRSNGGRVLTETRFTP